MPMFRTFSIGAKRDMFLPLPPAVMRESLFGHAVVSSFLHGAAAAVEGIQARRRAWTCLFTAGTGAVINQRMKGLAVRTRFMGTA